MLLDTASASPVRNERRPQPQREKRTLRRSILIAAICSVLLHAGLVVVFGDIHLGIPDFQQRPLAFRIPRAEVDPASLKPPPENTAGSTLKELNIPDVPDKDLDLTDIQARVPTDREISITPDVKKPENIQPGNSADGSLALESINPAALEDSLASLSNQGPRVPDLAPVASDSQPMIEAAAEGTDSGKAKDALDKAIASNQGLVDKFTTLEELMGVPGGKLTDIRKPIYMPSDLLFDFNETRLREGAKTSMMMLGILIDRNPDTIFVIQGHTDTIGTDASNLELSRKRAQAVSDWLQQSLRIDAARIRVEGLGESRPLVSPEGSIEDQQPNRRVEIQMLRPGGSPPPTAPAAPASLKARASDATDPDPPVRPARPVEPISPEPEVRVARPVDP